MRRVAVVIKIIFLLSAIIGAGSSHAVSKESSGFFGANEFDVVATTSQFYSADDDKPHVVELQSPPQVSVVPHHHYATHALHLSRFVDKPFARAPPSLFLT
jgi:hypothetical protein